MKFANIRILSFNLSTLTTVVDKIKSVPEVYQSNGPMVVGLDRSRKDFYENYRSARVKQAQVSIDGQIHVKSNKCSCS